MYEVIISKTFKKKYDKLPQKIKEIAKKILIKLQYELLGEQLKGDLKGIYSIHFDRNHYRILYTKDKNSIKIILLHIGKRTNSFYGTYKKNN